MMRKIPSHRLYLQRNKAQVIATTLHTSFGARKRVSKQNSSKLTHLSFFTKNTTPLVTPNSFLYI